ncbi:MAG: hypothetical protein M3436_03360 [Pseudomonadota bacterium]|nr:hypothetical protein [Pseudomonadota bacterium]
MITAVNSEDRLVQQTFAEHREKALGWNSIYAYNAKICGRRVRQRARRSATSCSRWIFARRSHDLC